MSKRNYSRYANAFLPNGRDIEVTYDRQVPSVFIPSQTREAFLAKKREKALRKIKTTNEQKKISKDIFAIIFGEK